MSTVRDELLGTKVLGRYRIVKRLARGGMGVLYLARAEGAAGFARPVVVKRILPDLTGDDAMTQMFVREARILSYLKHPGIVSVLDFTQEDSAYIMVLDYVHGFHLGRWLKYVREAHGHFPVASALQITIRVLDALHYAHELRRPDGKSLCVVHRDISPSNILVDVEGQVKLVDFGIARVMGETAMYKTEDTTVKGKFPYLAPELFNGQQPTAQSDLYASGLVLHELLCGKNEFRGRDMAETLHRVFTKTPSSIAELRDDVSPEIDAIIRKSLAKTPAGRWASAGAMAEALREVRGLTENAAEAALGAQVKRDFFSDMADVLHIEPLEVLDRAWRDGTVEVWEESPAVSERPPGSPSDAPPTGRLRVPTSTSKEMPALVGPAQGPQKRPAAGAAAASRRSPWLWVLVVAVALVGISALAFALVSQPDARQPQSVYVVTGSTAEESEAAETTTADDTKDAALAPDAASMDDSGETSPSGPSEPPEEKKHASRVAQRPKASARRPAETPKPSKSVDQATLITRTFQGKKGQMERCLQQHTEAATAQERIVFKFKVSAAGAVESVTLTPASLQGVPLGACLLGVAGAIRFPPHDDKMEFAIPVSTRAVRGGN